MSYVGNLADSITEYFSRNSGVHANFIGILIIKLARYTNFSNLFLEWNSTCFRQFLCPSSGIYNCTHRNSYMSNRFWWLLASKQSPKPKHVEFHSKSKFEKLVYLAGFIIRIYHDARSSLNVRFIRIFWSLVFNICLMPSYLNDGLTSIKFPRGKTLELYGRISLPPAKQIWQIWFQQGLKDL